MHQTVDRGHGRIEHRSVHTAPAPATVRFPHARQVLVLTRHVTDLAGGHLRTEVVYGITSLTPTRADPARLGWLVRGHWEIENRAHWVRDGDREKPWEGRLYGGYDRSRLSIPEPPTRTRRPYRQVSSLTGKSWTWAR